MFFQEKNFVRNLEFWFGFGYLNRENTSTCFIQPSNDVMEKYKNAFFKLKTDMFWGQKGSHPGYTGGTL